MERLDPIEELPEKNKKEEVSQGDSNEEPKEVFCFDTSSIEEKYIKLHGDAEKEINLKGLYMKATEPLLIEHFDQKRGFGFLNQTSSREKIFFHISDYAFRENTDRRRRGAQANEIETKIENREKIISLTTTRNEKGLMSKKWCFDQDIKPFLEEKIKNLITPEMREEIEQEIISQIDPVTLGEGEFIIRINNPVYFEGRIEIKPEIQEGNDGSFSVYYTTSIGEKSKKLPITFSEGIHVTKDGMRIQSIHNIREIEETYSPFESDDLILKKQAILPEGMTRNGNSGYPLHIENLYSTLIDDSEIIVESEKLLQDATSQYRPGFYHNTSHVVLKHPILRSAFKFRIDFTGLEIIDKKERGQYTDDVGDGIILPYVETADEHQSSGDKETTKTLIQKIDELGFQRKLEERIREFMVKKYASLVTNNEQRLFSGGYNITIETVSVPEKAPVIQIKNDSVINLIEEKQAKMLWNGVDKEMRNQTTGEMEERNTWYINMVAQKQKEDREKYVGEKPSEIIANRYAVYERIYKNIGTANRGYTSGHRSDIVTFLDLKTGSILYQETKTTRYGMVQYNTTLGGDGWRRGTRISGEKPGSWDEEKYVLADKKVEKDDIRSDRAGVYLKRKDIIQKNIQNLREGKNTDDEFKQIIVEIENRREE